MRIGSGELSTLSLEKPWDKSTLEYLKTHPTTYLLMLWKYIHSQLMEDQMILKCINHTTSRLLLEDHLERVPELEAQQFNI